MQNQSSVEKMAPMDELFFRSERDPIRRPTTYAIYPLDRTPRFSDVQHTLERATRQFLRMRQKVVEPTGGIGPAHWTVDPDFDLGFHVRRAAIPPFTGASQEDAMRALIEAIEPELMTPLDVSRPLWTLTLYEGFPDDSAVLFFKASHAIADGLGGLQIATLLFDEKRHAGLRPMPPAPPVETLTPDDLAARSLRALPGRAVGEFRGFFGEALRLGANLPARTREAREYVASLRRVATRSAPPSPLLAARSAARRLFIKDVRLAELKAAARGGGGSINDAYLALLAGAMRRYHDHLGQRIDAIPIAIPISTRTSDDEVGGNHFTGGMLALPLDEPDPRRCMRVIHEAVLKVREEVALGFFDRIMPAMLALPDAVTQRTAESIPVPDLQASNVPAQRTPIYFCGGRVEQQVGIGPVPGIGMMVTMISYCETCSISFHLDPAAITDVALFQRCLDESLAEILGLARDGGGGQG